MSDVKESSKVWVNDDGIKVIEYCHYAALKAENWHMSQRLDSLKFYLGETRWEELFGGGEK